MTPMATSEQQVQERERRGDDERMRFAARVIQRREDLGITQKTLQRKLSNIGHHMVEDWERGIYLPSYLNLKKLCKALYCSADYLLGLNEEQ